MLPPPNGSLWRRENAASNFCPKFRGEEEEEEVEGETVGRDTSEAHREAFMETPAIIFVSCLSKSLEPEV